MWLAAVCGVVVAATTFVLSDPLLTMLGAAGEVREQAAIYLSISLIGVPAMLVVLAGTGYLRGLQDTRTPLYVALGSALLNLVLELVLIPGLGFGIGASALSTVIAQWLAAAVYVAWVARAVRHHDVPLGPHGRTLARLAVVGRDLFLRTAALRGSLLLWVAVLQPVNGVVFVLDGLLIGAGDMGFLAWAMWIAFGVFAIGAVAVLVLGLGIGWLWTCLAALMLSRLTVLGLRWRTDRWAVTGAARQAAPAIGSGGSDEQDPQLPEGQVSLKYFSMLSEAVFISGESRNFPASSIFCWVSGFMMSVSDTPLRALAYCSIPSA